MRPRLNLASSLFCKRLPTFEDSRPQSGQAKTKHKYGEGIFYLSCMKGTDASILFLGNTEFSLRGKNLNPQDKSVKNLLKEIVCKQEAHLFR